MYTQEIFESCASEKGSRTGYGVRSVGRKPATELVRGQLNLDSAGYIIADESTRTNLPGVYAVGDVRTKALRQVVTAVADGASAAHFAEEYLAETTGA